MKVICDCTPTHREEMQQTMRLIQNGVIHVAFHCDSCGGSLDGVYSPGTHRYDEGGEG